MRNSSDKLPARGRLDIYDGSTSLVLSERLRVQFHPQTERKRSTTLHQTGASSGVARAGSARIPGRESDRNRSDVR